MRSSAESCLATAAPHAAVRQLHPPHRIHVRHHHSVGGRGIHSFTMKLNLSSFGTYSLVKSGH